jgi:hypothetical protein
MVSLRESRTDSYKIQATYKYVFIYLSLTYIHVNTYFYYIRKVRKHDFRVL